MFFIYGAKDSRACARAEFILQSLDYDYRAYRINIDYTISQLERLIPGVKTIPQIYFGTRPIGGLTGLYEFLQKNGSDVIDGDLQVSKKVKLEKILKIENLFNEMHGKPE